MWIRSLLCLTLAFGATAIAAPIVYVADLNGANESPSNASPGTGTAKVTLDVVAHTMLVEVEFSDLLGVTTASHIHCCTAAPNAGTVGVATVTPTFTDFPLGVTSGAYSRLFDLTLAASFNSPFVTANGGTAGGAEAALAAGMAAEMSYLNIHTVMFPGGEIRGFLTEQSAVPEPSTMLLSGGALLALAFFRRRRSAVR